MLSVWMASVCVCHGMHAESDVPSSEMCESALVCVCVCVCVSTSAALVRGVQTAQLVRD